MKIIEGMKKIKDYQRKAEDIRKLIQQYHVDLSHENPTYGTPEQQKQQVSEWLQAHFDIVKEIGKLRFQIQKTNVLTNVTIELGGKQVTKTIAEWLSRRKDLAALDASAWGMLNDKNLPASGMIKSSTGETKEVTLRRYYDPVTRDKKREEYRSEPSLIDGTLEVVNATTELSE